MAPCWSSKATTLNSIEQVLKIKGLMFIQCYYINGCHSRGVPVNSSSWLTKHFLWKWKKKKPLPKCKRTRSTHSLPAFLQLCDQMWCMLEFFRTRIQKNKIWFFFFSLNSLNYYSTLTNASNTVFWWYDDFLQETERFANGVLDISYCKTTNVLQI